MAEDTIRFITSNPNKLAEAKQILQREVYGMAVDLDEVQAMDTADVVRRKAFDAYRMLARPVVVEDTGLYINALNGFPGALIKWTLKSLGNEGICGLMKGYGDKTAYAEACVGLHDADKVHVFVGKVEGTIAPEPRGSNGFGWDPIFIPKGSAKTFAEMTDKEKNAVSMRRIAFERLKAHLDRKDYEAQMETPR